MLRRVGLAVALVLGSVGFALAIGGPSANATDVCFGNASMFTNAPLYWPIAGPPTAGQFIVNPNGGLCAGGPLPQMQGVYFGDCLSIQMTGTTSQGDNFNAVNVGGLLFFSGGVTGMAHLWADVFAGQSCLQGAFQFQLQFLAVTNSGPGPTIGPLPTIPGGPANSSNDCTATVPVDTTVFGEDVKLVVESTSTTVTVCIRVGTASGLGGKLVITTPSGLPTAGLPTTDGDVNACAASDNQIPEDHPMIVGQGPVPHLVDAYVGPAGVMACISLNGTDLRVLIPSPGMPSGGADADWYPDPGTPG